MRQMRSQPLFFLIDSFVAFDNGSGKSVALILGNSYIGVCCIYILSYYVVSFFFILAEKKSANVGLFKKNGFRKWNSNYSRNEFKMPLL